MFTVQVNVLGRALPLLYEEAVNPDSSVGSIVHMVTGDLSAEENQIFIDAYAFETTTLAAINKEFMQAEHASPFLRAGRGGMRGGRVVVGGGLKKKTRITTKAP